MTIYTLAQLRSTAPESYRALPDDVLVCKYLENVGLSASPDHAFNLFGVSKPSFFSCEQLIYLYELKFPTNGLAVAVVAGLGVVIAITLYKICVNRSRNSQHATAIKLASMAGALSILLGTFSLFRNNVITALSIFLVWSVVTVPTLFFVGYLYRLVKSNGVAALMKQTRRWLVREKKLRESQVVWLQVSDEIEVGSIDKALWAQCLAKAGGDEAKAKSDYMIKRYDQLEVGAGDT